MLVLTRNVRQSVQVGDVKFVIVRLCATSVRVGIDAPADTLITRTELLGAREDLSVRRIGIIRKTWLLFGYCLPRKVRLESFDLCYHEMSEDLCEAYRRHPGGISRLIIAAGFTLRTGLTLGQCLWIAIGGVGRKIVTGAFVAWLARRDD